jgi:hypothetical protein
LDGEKDLTCLDDVLVTSLDVQDRDRIGKAIEAGNVRAGLHQFHAFAVSITRRGRENLKLNRAILLGYLARIVGLAVSSRVPSL